MKTLMILTLLLVLPWTITIADDCCVQRGDIDHNGQIDVADIDYVVTWMFAAGPEPPCLDEADVNGDGGIDISDLLHLIDYVFHEGPSPAGC